ncbi:type I-F CRISPR-associated endoribonuclease Cas6/Csy4 [Providencia burhodogranariea]|uniref:CRISPR-associated Csy4 family protein n=1 Tax=Providencia burhodogranariea DSM 19968 TaxID=1141662 RepID=K8WNS7_9GAMM|nr:type I-F CRISPR-associated endoribonuclease Cas6/Csy4 [Providencia burhodogranariea]EKT62224.1 CRISPR-associated Csy4 family protein [Providencia burhodogranariea DSM 19968]
MNYYQEITLLPDPTIPLDFLWQKVYQQIHIALVENKSSDGHSAIAVAFPEYGSVGFRLGRKIRLFAMTEGELTQLNMTKWLSRLADYVHIKSIQSVPEHTRAVSYVRQHVKGERRIESDMHKKAQLWAEKTGQSKDVCLAVLKKNRPEAHNRLPFLWMESQQTKAQSGEGVHRPFPLFIKRISAEQAQVGLFNCYGLSQITGGEANLATVPHF